MARAIYSGLFDFDEDNDTVIQQSEMLKLYKEVYDLKYDEGSTIGLFLD